MPDYDPRHDPAFVDVVVSYLLHRSGEWCRLGQTFNADVWSVRDAVMVARRLGLIVQGGRRGYRFLGFVRPRYVHLKSAASWPHSEPHEVPGQLCVFDEAAVECAVNEKGR